MAGFVADEHLALQGSMLFGFGSNQICDASRVIASPTAGVGGYPTEITTSRPTPSPEETRHKYLLHVQKMLELLGQKPDAARADARTVLDIETALAKASLTRVDKRDPYKLYHKVTRAQFEASTPSFGWGFRYFGAVGLPGLTGATSPSRSCIRSLKNSCAGGRSRTGGLICAGTWRMRRRDICLLRSCRRISISTQISARCG